MYLIGQITQTLDMDLTSAQWISSEKYVGGGSNCNVKIMYLNV